MVFHWSLSDSKSPQVSRTLLSILTDLNNDICKLDGFCLSYFQVLQFLYQSFGDCIKSTNYKWYHRNFHVPQFFNSRTKSRSLFFFIVYFSFTLWSVGRVKSTIRQVLLFFCFFFFLVGVLSLGLVVWPRLGDLFVSQNPREICASHSGLYKRHLLVWSNFSFLHNSKWITFPTQPCLGLVLYSFCANLLHSLIMLVIVLSLSPHNLHLLLCCVLSILALI